jgi:hypothetical protein
VADGFLLNKLDDVVDIFGVDLGGCPLSTSLEESFQGLYGIFVGRLEDLYFVRKNKTLSDYLGYCAG